MPVIRVHKTKYKLDINFIKETVEKPKKNHQNNPFSVAVNFLENCLFGNL